MRPIVPTTAPWPDCDPAIRPIVLRVPVWAVAGALIDIWSRTNESIFHAWSGTAAGRWFHHEERLAVILARPNVQWHGQRKPSYAGPSTVQSWSTLNIATRRGTKSRPRLQDGSTVDDHSRPSCSEAERAARRRSRSSRLASAGEKTYKPTMRVEDSPELVL